jgi:uncharacterized cysteine cluster protein YcgN (CxxCxxCC family)
MAKSSNVSPFCVKLGKSSIETLKMLCKAFGEYSLSQTAVSEWHSRFKAGQATVKDDKCSRRPRTSETTENVEEISEFIYEDHC